MLFDWANQPFQTLIVTFIFAPYFAAEVIGDPVRGQALWGTAAAIGGGDGGDPRAAARRDGRPDRARARPGCSASRCPIVLGCLGFWLAVPGMADPRIVLAAYLLAFIGSEFGQIFTNAMLPDLGPRARDRAHLRLGLGARLSRRAGLAGRWCSRCSHPRRAATRTLIGIAPLFGLDPAAGEPARATGPLAALWYVVFALPLFLWTPDAPRAAGGGRAAGGARATSPPRSARCAGTAACSPT